MAEQFIPIRSWAADDQPREKLQQKGVSSLSNNELLAIILRSGSDGETALDLSRRILADCSNDLNALGKLNSRELINRYKGVGMAKATAIIAAVELGRRRGVEDEVTPSNVDSSKDVYTYISPCLQDLDHEELWMIFLNRANHILGSEKMSAGGMSGTIMDVRLLFRKALDMRSHAIIVAHNHPSGSLDPSTYDKVMTEKIRHAGKIVDINLLDHVIVSGRSYFSFADNGLL